MARLIDYHTNDVHGGDIRTTVDVDEEGYLTATTTPQDSLGASMVADVGTYLGGVMSAVLTDGTLRTDHPATDSLNRTDHTLDQALATITKLNAAATWLIGQAEAGNGVDVDEIRTRFDIPAPDTDTAATPAPPADAGITRGRRGRPAAEPTKANDA